MEEKTKKEEKKKGRSEEVETHFSAVPGFTRRTPKPCVNSPIELIGPLSPARYRVTLPLALSAIFSRGHFEMCLLSVTHTRGPLQRARTSRRGGNSTARTPAHFRRSLLSRPAFPGGAARPGAVLLGLLKRLPCYPLSPRRTRSRSHSQQQCRIKRREFSILVRRPRSTFKGGVVNVAGRISEVKRCPNEVFLHAALAQSVC